MPDPLQDLSDLGVAIWLDDLSRPRILSGDLARLAERRHVVGVTTNPTIFAKALASGSGYEDQVRDLALRGTAIGEAVRLLTAWDVRAACDVLRPVSDRTGGRDGRVSIEVDPRIAQDAEPHGGRGARAVVAGGPAQPVHTETLAGPAQDAAPGSRRPEQAASGQHGQERSG